MTQQPDERDCFLDFLERLTSGGATVEDWNHSVLRRYKDPEVEQCRRRLADLGLSIGQCSAIPFPAALRQVAAELRDDLAMNL